MVPIEWLAITSAGSILAAGWSTRAGGRGDIGSTSLWFAVCQEGWALPASCRCHSSKMAGGLWERRHAGYQLCQWHNSINIYIYINIYHISKWPWTVPRYPVESQPLDWALIDSIWSAQKRRFVMLCVCCISKCYSRTRLCWFCWSLILFASARAGRLGLVFKPCRWQLERTKPTRIRSWPRKYRICGDKFQHKGKWISSGFKATQVIQGTKLGSALCASISKFWVLQNDSFSRMTCSVQSNSNFECHDLPIIKELADRLANEGVTGVDSVCLFPLHKPFHWRVMNNHWLVSQHTIAYFELEWFDHQALYIFFLSKLHFGNARLHTTWSSHWSSHHKTAKQVALCPGCRTL